MIRIASSESKWENKLKLLWHLTSLCVRVRNHLHHSFRMRLRLPPCSVFSLSSSFWHCVAIVVIYFYSSEIDFSLSYSKPESRSIYQTIGTFVDAGMIHEKMWSTYAPTAMYMVVTHKPVDMFRSTVCSFKLYADGDIGHVTYLLVVVTESFATQTITVIMWCTSFEMNAFRCPSSTRQLMSISLYIMRAYALKHHSILVP